MTLEKLLALFSAFDANRVAYAATGDLADLLRGRAALSERLEISVDNVDHALSILEQAWPQTEIIAALEVRVLPPNTPFYIDVIARTVVSVDLLSIRGVMVRVAAADDQFLSRDVWSRPGFTLRERLAALHELTRELVPAHVLSGVRKYRSIEQASAARERWDTERADRLSAERLRN
jgi:hypothetical protein